MKKIICIICVILLLFSMFIEIILLKKSNKTILKIKRQKEKMQRYYNLYSKWIDLDIKNKDISEYLLENGISKVIIYGFGPIGINLYDYLLERNIEVVCVVDKGLLEQSGELCVRKIDSLSNTDVDAVIVTAVHVYESVYNDLRKKIKCPILSLENILYKI